MVEYFGVLNMETPAVGPAKQENTPQQEKAKTDDDTNFEKSQEIKQTNKILRGNSMMSTPDLKGKDGE